MPCQSRLRNRTMGRSYTKRQAVSIAISAARLYRDHFAGNQILFVYTDKHKQVGSLQVRFNAGNYLHLTGLSLMNRQWTSVDFYKACINGRLKEDDIAFADNGTTNQKLQVLPHVFNNANLSASMIGTYNRSHPLLYTEQLAGGVKWAIRFRDVTGTGDYVPDTLLEGDIRNNVHITYRIIATYIKRAQERTCTRMIYKARRIDYNRLRYPADWGDRPRVTP